VPARPEKQVVVSGLGRQVSTAAWTVRHEKVIGPVSAGPHRTGPDRARAGRPVWKSIAASRRADG
jgi:hypothetical protein